jgi:methionyl aminopeptidase
MSIRSQAELNKLRAIGKIVKATLDEMSAAVRPGVTTAELDRIGAAVLARHGAESSPPKVYGFPGATCISVNEEAIHGIPGSRVLQPGDLVKLDVTAEKDGFVADAAVTVGVGEVSPVAAALKHCAERSFREALKVAHAGNRVYEIGRSVEREVRQSGFSVIRELCGHGVGRTIHEPPSVPNFHDARCRSKLTEGLVITIEPIIAAGHGSAELQADKWTVCTSDKSLAAHYEHTIVITANAPILLTAA